MKPFDHQPERYQPTGGISGDGIQNQLGRPRLDRLTLLIREAVQNSWDARAKPHGGVRFSVGLSTLKEQERRWLATKVFRSKTGTLDLGNQLSTRSPLVLSIADKGTVGLSGPSRADVGVRGQPSNFVDLLRHIGRAPTNFRGGGTYGFGKTALFLASEVRTIVAYSQFRSGRKMNQRLMVAAVGSEYEEKVGKKLVKFTGRHWWGRRGAGEVVDPLEGRDALEAARSIGIANFRASETGTTILILLPDLGGKEPDDAMRLMGGAILQTFWPKMIDGVSGEPSMQFDLRLEGRRIPLPAPETVPPIGSFIHAFENLQAHLAGKKLPHKPGELAKIVCHRPIKDLGILSLIRTTPQARLPADSKQIAGPFTGPSHHVALLRGPHFVVRYLEGPAIPFDQAEYAGVFLASEEAEEAFARSEPPTHDDWSPDMLVDRHERTFVRVAVRRLDELLEAFTGGTALGQGAQGDLALGAFSDRLGALLPTAPGPGARSQAMVDRPGREGGGLGGRPRPPGAQITSTTLRSNGAGLPTLVVSFELGAESLKRDIWIQAIPSVLLDEGAVETDPPQGGLTPRVVRWRSALGRSLGRSSVLHVPAGTAGPFELDIEMPSDAAVAVDLSTSFTEP